MVVKGNGVEEPATGADAARYTSGKSRVCKTLMQGFDSPPGLHSVESLGEIPLMAFATVRLFDMIRIFLYTPYTILEIRNW